MQIETPGNDLAFRLITEAVETGPGDLDVSAIDLLLEELADSRIQRTPSA